RIARITTLRPEPYTNRRVASTRGRPLRRTPCHVDVVGQSVHLSLGYVCCFSSCTPSLASVSAGVLKGEISPTERAISVGAAVFTADGALIGRVSGLSRDVRGQVERIRVTETSQTGSGRSILIIGNTDFLFAENAAQRCRAWRNAEGDERGQGVGLR